MYIYFIQIYYRTNEANGVIGLFSPIDGLTHTLLKSIFHQVVNEHLTDRLQNPIYQALVFSHISKSGQFFETSTISKNLAGLLYCIRSITLLEYLQLPTSATDEEAFAVIGFVWERPGRSVNVFEMLLDDLRMARYDSKSNAWKLKIRWNIAKTELTLGNFEI